MQSGLLPLDKFDALLVQGPEAKKFLQGQLSCDVDALDAQQSLRGALCNLKGRVIADFRLLQWQDDCYLQLNDGMSEKVKSVLDKYIVFSKAKISDAGNRFKRWGLIGNDAHHFLEQIMPDCPMVDDKMVGKEGCIVIKIPGLTPRYEIWLDQQSDSDFGSTAIAALQKSVPGIDAANWELEDIRAGIVHVNPGQTENYLPQQLNYDISGVINFKKGCYTGQEIVARMYYRSTAKKRLFYLLGATSGCSNAVSVYQPQEEPVQEHEVLIAGSGKDGNCHLLAILPVELADNAGGFCLTGSQSQLTVQGLPYAP